MGEKKRNNKGDKIVYYIAVSAVFWGGGFCPPAKR
jgi:hypothetical protein